MLIKPGLLSRIERRVGPKTDESLFEILRDTGPVPQGAGFSRGADVLVATVPGRSTHMSDLNLQVRQTNQAVTLEADYIITLKAGTDVRNEDLLREIAMPWTPNKYYFSTQKSVPVFANGNIYTVISPGNSGSTEPVWSTVRGTTTTDNSVTWRCEGPYKTFRVLEIASPSTFGDYITKRVMAKYQQI